MLSDAVTSFGRGVPSGIVLDPYRRAKGANLKAAVAGLVRDLEAAEMRLGLRKRQRDDEARDRFRLAVEVLACNFLVIQMTASDSPLAVPKSSAAMWGPAHSKPKIYGKHFLDALNVLEHPQIGMIERVATGYRFEAGTGGLSTVRARPKLLTTLAVSVDGWDGFTREPPTEVLILKASKAKGEVAVELDYRETGRTRKLRKEVEVINEYLSSAPIHLNGGPGHLDEDGQPVDPTKRFVRRIFNNGVWTEGGRLYGAFWETMPKAMRRELLRIGSAKEPAGEPIANVDYGQLFPRLAYVRADISDPPAELYDVFGDGSSRAGVKKLLNALLFHKGRLTHWPIGTAKYFGGMKLADAVAAIYSAHQPIAHLFGTGIGHKLAFMESNILIEVLVRLRFRNIVALPLHDAVLVAQSNAETAKHEMEEAFAAALGRNSRVPASVEIT
ncbi:MAG: hypothetical protein E5Y51_05660 [Mesorhizobium sp.]|uniref:hypothetical protein n=1 Tax=Mesorhizobium sp. M1A.F.Ca.IN.022.06.1.1 TaxID=2493680 RepID=UPI000F75F425|nr:hypothetical protein [Mesorhizobium sp. M1A.F.Ca.IN.022.06.1.1]AZO61234.1 hypothetical protein EJ078_19730 [Mesorhizobium sp. M1A.F.Ca.IN.022.06.1.1]TIN19686.1 MAG: hypothetical protein E5Y51_05660 [Mesorhizobium sp.]